MFACDGMLRHRRVVGTSIRLCSVLMVTGGSYVAMVEMEQRMATKRAIGCGSIELRLGDITKFIGDAIVNAANTSLLGGGGVDGAIHRAGGPAILADCEKIRARQGGCGIGKAVTTGAGRLSAMSVIHAVGPVWSGGNNNERELLRLTYEACFAEADVVGARSIAFPSISTGTFRFPLETASQIALAAIASRLRREPEIEVCVFLFSQGDFDQYRANLAVIVE